MDYVGPKSLQDSHDRSAFDCGRASLNIWLVERAIRAQINGDTRTFVILGADGSRVVGYHALAAGAVVRGDIPSRLRRNAPDPVPAILIARLAVDIEHRARGLGRRLLRDAVSRAASAADGIGARLLIVHALDDEAAAFYERFGFVHSDSIPNLMLMRMDDIRKTLGVVAGARDTGVGPLEG